MYCRWTNDPTRKGRPRRPGNPPPYDPATTPGAYEPRTTPARTALPRTAPPRIAASRTAPTRPAPTCVPPVPRPFPSAVTETSPEVTP